MIIRLGKNIIKLVNLNRQEIERSQEVSIQVIFDELREAIKNNEIETNAVTELIKDGMLIIEIIRDEFLEDIVKQGIQDFQKLNIKKILDNNNDALIFSDYITYLFGKIIEAKQDVIQKAMTCSYNCYFVVKKNDIGDMEFELALKTDFGSNQISLPKDMFKDPQPERLKQIFATALNEIHQDINIRKRKMFFKDKGKIINMKDFKKEK